MITSIHFSEANFAVRNPHRFPASYIELCMTFIKQHGPSYTAWAADGKPVLQMVGPSSVVDSGSDLD